MNIVHPNFARRCSWDWCKSGSFCGEGEGAGNVWSLTRQFAKCGERGRFDSSVSRTKCWKGFRFRGLRPLSPNQGPPAFPRYSLELRICHVCQPHIFDLAAPMWSTILLNSSFSIFSYFGFMRTNPDPRHSPVRGTSVPHSVRQCTFCLCRELWNPFLKSVQSSVSRNNSCQRSNVNDKQCNLCHFRKDNLGFSTFVYFVWTHTFVRILFATERLHPFYNNSSDNFLC